MTEVAKGCGEQKELVWKESDKGIGGRSVANWYELIPVKAIKTVEFTSPN